MPVVAGGRQSPGLWGCKELVGVKTGTYSCCTRARYLIVVLVCDLCGHRGLWFVCALQVAPRAALGWGGHPPGRAAAGGTGSPRQSLPCSSPCTGKRAGRGECSRRCLGWAGWGAQSSLGILGSLSLQALVNLQRLCIGANISVLYILYICACWYFKPCCF